MAWPGWWRDWNQNWRAGGKPGGSRGVADLLSQIGFKSCNELFSWTLGQLSRSIRTFEEPICNDDGDENDDDNYDGDDDNDDYYNDDDYHDRNVLTMC